MVNVFLTDKGRREIRPTEIKPSQWAEVAADVVFGSCVVRYGGSIVENVEYSANDYYILFYKQRDEFDFDPYDEVHVEDATLSVTWLPDTAKPASEPEADAGEESRDGILRTSLFRRVLDALDLALAYLPGELAEFPERVQSTVNDFRDYANIANKQIEERDLAIAALRRELADAQAVNARLRTALAFYGDSDNYTDDGSVVTWDMGKKARDALNAVADDGREGGV